MFRTNEELALIAHGLQQSLIKTLGSSYFSHCPDQKHSFNSFRGDVVTYWTTLDSTILEHHLGTKRSTLGSIQIHFGTTWTTIGHQFKNFQKLTD